MYREAHGSTGTANARDGWTKGAQIAKKSETWIPDTYERCRHIQICTERQSETAIKKKKERQKQMDAQTDRRKDTETKTGIDRIGDRQENRKDGILYTNHKSVRVPPYVP